MTDFGKQSSIEEAKTRIESLISDQIRVLQDKMKEFEIQSAVRYKVVHGRHYYGWPEFVTKANGEYWKFGKTDFDENLDLVFLSPDPDKAEIFFCARSITYNARGSGHCFSQYRFIFCRYGYREQKIR